eukprot:3750662-Amphidinium_carterae.1
MKCSLVASGLPIPSVGHVPVLSLPRVGTLQDLPSSKLLNQMDATLGQVVHLRSCAKKPNFDFDCCYCYWV